MGTADYTDYRRFLLLITALDSKTSSISTDQSRFFSLLFGLYALVLKLRGAALSGFTTVIILQLLIGSMLVTALGIIGEYISKVYDEVKGRPRFIVADTLEARDE